MILRIDVNSFPLDFTVLSLSNRSHETQAIVNKFIIITKKEMRKSSRQYT